MKLYLTLLLYSFCTVFGLAQKLQLEKASPFTAVKWEENIPIVKFEGNWYKLKKLDKYEINQIIDFCKKNYNRKWQKRFSEDLVEVLQNMKSQPTVEVKLLLLNKSQGVKEVLGTYTYENRQKVLEFNDSLKVNQPKNITKAQAIEDVVSFLKILNERSSYLHLSNFDCDRAIELLKTKISNSKTDIDINFLTHELAKIMSEIGDRHSSIVNNNFKVTDLPTYTLHLPFLLTSVHGKAVALKRNNTLGNYEYQYKKYPYLKSINNLTIKTIVDSLTYKSKKAPKEAKFSLGISQIQQLGKLYFKNNLTLPKKTKIIFTNGKKDTTVFVQLNNINHKYHSKIQRETNLEITAIKKGNFKSVSKLLKNDIGYLKIPQMFSFNEIPGLREYLDSTFTNFDDTKALIIDLSYNSGGVRDIVPLIGTYIIPKSESPWVANIAYLRTKTKDSIYESMSNRLLHTYEEFDKSHKSAINRFHKKKSLPKEFNKTAFSEPHYMILKSGDRHYLKPVYLLVNEYSFSAASILVSSFKELPNVKIVGITTDGSSGNSKKVNLKHSKIRIKLSTMLSYQRNGKTLDGNGTRPDIPIKRNEKQVLIGDDYQLNVLINLINSTN